MLASLTATSIREADRRGGPDRLGRLGRQRLDRCGLRPRDPAGLARRPQRDDLREDRERDLLRGLGADLESRRRVQPVTLLLGDVEGFAHGTAANLACNQRHVRDSRPQRLGEHPLLVMPV